jgi:hypothetical protein
MWIAQRIYERWYRDASLTHDTVSGLVRARSDSMGVSAEKSFAPQW